MTVEALPPGGVDGGGLRACLPHERNAVQT